MRKLLMLFAGLKAWRELTPSDRGHAHRRSNAPLWGGIGIGMGIGALLMYIFDPVWGNRRRSLARNQMTRALHKTSDALDATTRDLRNRTMGTFAEARHLFTSEHVDDDVLVARIRSRMGRVVSHPHAVDVIANEGHITLRGQIRAREERALIRCARSVRGVRGVDNQLDVRASADSRPSLQGGPSSRQGAGREKGIRIDKSVNIQAPLEDVFGFWANYENFPLFMRNVREVIGRGDGRSHWKVAGPAGSSVEWDAEITEWRENEIIAWQSLPGASVANSGMIKFLANPEGTTRVDVHLSYTPPAGVIGHAVASLFGADPKKEITEDLNRMKTMIETGNAPHDAADPLLRDIQETH